MPFSPSASRPVAKFVMRYGWASERSTYSGRMRPDAESGSTKRKFSAPRAAYSFSPAASLIGESAATTHALRYSKTGISAALRAWVR